MKDWLEELDSETRDCVTAAVEILAALGPSLGRTLVDSVAGSRHPNMKELRPPSPGMTEFRILFAFDSKRHAILLFGGDKSGNAVKKGAKRYRWARWYQWVIPEADRRYDEHLGKLRNEEEGEDERA